MEATITTDDLKSKLDHKQIMVVETLAPERYREAHIPSAINIPPEKIKELAPKLLPVKDAVIITYCSSTAFDTPAKTPPVNWRPWVTRM
jgi:rhodanese-related sulfurtransferase